MTALEPQVRNLPTAVPAGSVTGRPVTRICPYLSAADGAWRSTTVAREHRCGAVAPPAPLATEKQRRLCLTPDYPSCATFEAARAARPIGHDRAPTLPRPMARTTPVVLDHGRLAITVPILSSDRSTGQAVLIVLMALAFAAIVLAKLTGGSPAAGERRIAASRRRRRLGGSIDGRQRRPDRHRRDRPERHRPRDGRDGRVRRALGAGVDAGARDAQLQGQGRRHADRHRGQVRDDAQGDHPAERHQRPVEPQDRSGPEDPLTGGAAAPPGVRRARRPARRAVSAGSRGSTT